MNHFKGKQFKKDVIIVQLLMFDQLNQKMKKHQTFVLRSWKQQNIQLSQWN